MICAIAYAINYDPVPVYRNELRHLPEKLKQERIRETINNTFTLIQDQVMQSAIRNEHETNFTLFCLEPNLMQKKMDNIYRKQGSTYVLLEPEEYQGMYNENLHMYPPELVPLPVKPHCSVKDGYELYNRHGGVTQPYPPDHPYYIPLDFTATRKPGIARQNLEQEPILYVQQFFQLFNHHFPDLTLTISHDRTSEGIFDKDCCPVYIVSW